MEEIRIPKLRASRYHSAETDSEAFFINFNDSSTYDTPSSDEAKAVQEICDKLSAAMPRGVKLKIKAGPYGLELSAFIDKNPRNAGARKKATVSTREDYEWLKSLPVAEAMEVKGISRSTYYRMMKELAERFETEEGSQD